MSLPILPRAAWAPRPHRRLLSRPVLAIASGLVAASLVCLGGCKSEREAMKRIPCRKVAARARQCQQATLRLMKKRGLARKRKYLADWARGELQSLTSEAYCKKKVAAVTRYLAKVCTKHTDSRPCTRAKKKHVRRMKALRRCFSLGDCDKVAACYLDEYAQN